MHQIGTASEKFYVEGNVLNSDPMEQNQRTPHRLFARPNLRLTIHSPSIALYTLGIRTP